jgi:hypothetical protein
MVAARCRGWMSWLEAIGQHGVSKSSNGAKNRAVGHENSGDEDCLVGTLRGDLGTGQLGDGLEWKRKLVFFKHPTHVGSGYDFFLLKKETV